MKCPFQTKTVTTKGVKKAYCFPQDITTVEFSECEMNKCMAYENGKCTMIKTKAVE